MNRVDYGHPLSQGVNKGVNEMLNGVRPIIVLSELVFVAMLFSLLHSHQAVGLIHRVDDGHAVHRSKQGVSPRSALQVYWYEYHN